MACPVAQAGANISGAGIIGVCTAYYITKHPRFSPKTHHITILEARRPASGASGKAGGLLAMWAFPQQIVPLSFQLHHDLAEEYNGATEWGYRGLKTLCVEGNISASNLRNIANQKNPKQTSPDLPEDLDWINTDIIDGWAHLGGADSTAQVQPYKFTHFILSKVLETGAVSLVTGKVTEILTNAAGQATGVRYTTSTDKKHGNHQTYSHSQNPARLSNRNVPAQANKSSLHHPDNPAFNQQSSSLHAPNLQPSPAIVPDSITAPKTSSFRNIHKSDFASPPEPPNTFELSDSSSPNVSSDVSTCGDNESILSSEDSGPLLDSDANESEDLTSDSLADALAESDKIQASEQASKTAAPSHTETLEGDQIVLTLGPWTSKILPSCPISGLRAHSITIQPTKAVSPFALFTEMRTSRTSYVSPEIYPRKDEVYVCGEGDSFTDVPETTDDVEVLRERCDELFKHVGYISPQLKNGRILKRQACYLPVVDVPSHSGPFIGSTNVDNLYLASGHSCWGINNAPATGLLMAEILLDGEATSASVDGLEPEFYFDASLQQP